MRRTPLIAGLVLSGLVAAGVVVMVTREGDATATDLPEALATATIARRDMVTYDETTATLGFVDSVTVSAPDAGTVTTIVSSGDAIVAGSVVATIDGSPVVAMVGDVPGYRDLSTSSSDGIDVRQLETNLVALGFDPDGEITIDEEYDNATADAVDRWKVTLGLEEDGEVAKGLVVFVPGDLQTDTVSAGVGSGVSAGGELLTARMTARRVQVAAAADHVISALAAAGTEVFTGTVLYWLDGLPVAAIEGDPSALPVLDRDLSLGVDAGSDVKLLETMLTSLGFNSDGRMVVDDTFDQATSNAVLAWWQSIDPSISVDATQLVVPAGSFVVVPADLQVGDAYVDADTTLTADARVLDLTSPARAVSTTAPVGDDTFAVGAEIEVVFPDRSTSTGEVVAVGNVASDSSNTPGATPSVDITIQVDDIPHSVDSFVSIPVTLRVIDQQVDDAFVVPTSALVALQEGGYALNVVDQQATATSPALTHLIAVEPTLYSDGFVVVTGDQLAEGLEVVVPS